MLTHNSALSKQVFQTLLTLSFSGQISLCAEALNKEALDNAAKAIQEAKKQVETVDKEFKKLDKEWDKRTLQKNSKFLNVEFFTGAKLLNPYSINIDSQNNTATLNPSESKAVGFIELNVFARNVIRTGIYSSETNSNEDSDKPKFNWLKMNKKDWFLPDFDFKVGYSFQNDKPEKFEASTIAGGSDLYLEGGLGQPILRIENIYGWKAQTTLEAAGGFTTDDSFNRVHPNLFFGGGFQMAYTPNGETPGAGDTYVLLRTGYGSFDQPILTTGRNVKLDVFNLPEFEQTWAPSVGTTLLFKANAAVSFQIASNVYFSDRANWNISAGLSLDPSTFFKK
jgi:hypothetical protein